MDPGEHAGKPVARVSSLERPAGKRRIGILDGQISVPDDFNTPLPENVIESFYGAFLPLAVKGHSHPLRARR